MSWQILPGQFPHTCSCCKEVIRTEADWALLKGAGIMGEEAPPAIELRNHSCDSTIAVEVDPVGKKYCPLCGTSKEDATFSSNGNCLDCVAYRQTCKHAQIVPEPAKAGYYDPAKPSNWPPGQWHADDCGCRECDPDFYYDDSRVEGRW